MSAASPKIQDKAQEPSMEDILASIRRIIADDQAAKPEDANPLPEAQNDDVLDLAEIAQPVRKPAPIPVPVPTALPEPEPVPQPKPFAMPNLDLDEEEIAFADPVPEPVSPPAPPAAPPAAPRKPERLQAAIEQEAVERLVSRATDESVGRAFNLLSHTVLSHNARTLEELVAEMLRPMLKEWLDENLPSMVERLVKAEIERVARGR